LTQPEDYKEVKFSEFLALDNTDLGEVQGHQGLVVTQRGLAGLAGKHTFYYSRCCINYLL